MAAWRTVGTVVVLLAVATGRAGPDLSADGNRQGRRLLPRPPGDEAQRRDQGKPRRQAGVAGPDRQGHPRVPRARPRRRRPAAWSRRAPASTKPPPPPSRSRKDTESKSLRKERQLIVAQRPKDQPLDLLAQRRADARGAGTGRRPLRHALPDRTAAGQGSGGRRYLEGRQLGGPGAVPLRRPDRAGPHLQARRGQGPGGARVGQRPGQRHRTGRAGETEDRRDVSLRPGREAPDVAGVEADRRPRSGAGQPRPDGDQHDDADAQAHRAAGCAGRRGAGVGAAGLQGAGGRCRWSSTVTPRGSSS